MPYFDHFRRLQPTVLGERVVRLENEQMLRDMVRLQEAGESILEIGPGRGAFAALCREEGFRYTAVEANEAMAADLERQGLSVIRAFVPPLPECLREFDFVFCSNVIEHMAGVREARALVRGMLEAARSGGLVCIGAPDYLSWQVHFWHADYTHNFVTSGRRLRQMLVDEEADVLLEAFFSGPYGGSIARVTSLMARLFPSAVLGAILKPFVSSERLYKAKITFLGRVFVIGRRP